MPPRPLTRPISSYKSMAGIIAVYGLVVSVLIVGSSGSSECSRCIRNSGTDGRRCLISHPVAPESDYSLYAYVICAIQVFGPLTAQDRS